MVKLVNTLDFADATSVKIMIDKIVDKKRIDWIDFARGIGVILVVLGHSKIPFFAGYVAYAFHIPFFFILSGVCFKVHEGESFWDFLLKKLKTLIVPYFFIAFLMFCAHLVMTFISGHLSIIAVVDNLLPFLIQRHYQTIWFLACLFWCEICAYIILKNVKSRALHVMIMLLCGVTAFLYYTFVNATLPWVADLVPIALFFFLLGYTFKNLLNIELKHKLVFSVVMFALSLVINYLNVTFLDSKGDVFFNCYGIYILFLLSSICGSVALIAFSQVIQYNRVVNYIGKNSIPFFTLHQLMFLPLSRLYGILGVDNIFVKTVYWLICSIVCILFLYLFNEFIIHTPFSVLIGKPYKKQNSKAVALL